FQGNTQPDIDLIEGQLSWGDSVLQSVMDAIKQADGTAANIASLVLEAKIDIIKVPNFMASLAKEDYKAKILERYSVANTAKGINGTMLVYL
ncbi:anti-CBASS protein Acb1 family protein, partial [Mesorhizobium japonicum]|uniref:anti-CBASS protein Acb1 family protein n=1 Tax=Mesorhizobium japonicum TaxID=2066070 RepID=UPI003B5C4677